MAVAIRSTWTGRVFLAVVTVTSTAIGWKEGTGRYATAITVVIYATGVIGQGQGVTHGQQVGHMMETVRATIWTGRRFNVATGNS